MTTDHRGMGEQGALWRRALRAARAALGRLGAPRRASGAKGAGTTGSSHDARDGGAAAPEIRVPIVTTRDGALHLRLRSTGSGGTSTAIEARIEPPGGELTITGRDLGALPRVLFGAAEYEYILRVAPKDKDRLLLTLLYERFAGPTLDTSMMRRWMDEHGIASEVFTWHDRDI